MACTRPLRGFRGKNGKLTLSISGGFSDQPQEVPCGQCMHCRLEKSRQRALQCLHEASLYPKNAFLTLTYNDASLPAYGSLVKRHFQLFMKKYRKYLNSHKISYYMCGEYGEVSQRPHYHCILFNHDFSDKIFYKNANGLPLYNSPKLNELWGLGNCIIGTVTFESAAYVARYVTKKKFGPKADNFYGHIINTDTGEITPRRIKEYAHPSHGLGKKWLAKFLDETYPSDSVPLRGRLVRPPKYYDKRFAQFHPEEWAEIKRARIAQAKKSLQHNTWERRLASEVINAQQIQLLKRIL